MAMVGCTVIWIAIVAVSPSPQLLTLGAGGGLLTATLFLLLQSQQIKLRGLAETDALTRLTNYGGFHGALAREVAKADSNGGTLSLVTLDLDDFKAINDTHGHPYGDSVLHQVGEKLLSSVRGSDTAARIGGEEFALLLPGTGTDLAYEIAERVRAAVAAVPVTGGELRCSAGVAVYPDDAEDRAALVERADKALYAAKRGGKGHTRRFNSARPAISTASSEYTQIQGLLADEEAIVSVFQPVVALATGRVIGYEALSRFPTLPDRPPPHWFAQAHACGLGAELEAAAVRAALKPIGRAPGTHLAINLSPSALASETVRQTLPRDLTEIVIEVTEHEDYAGDDRLGEIVQDLRSRGARIALDDAGAGYAGLTHLVWLRPDIVKLDCDLTERVHADPARMALIESFVRFARRVGATVCAEGIESFEDLTTLANLDVAWGQGYAIARPAAPWPNAAAGVPGACDSALEQALRSAPAGGPSTISAGDRALEHLSARLAAVGTQTHLNGVLAMIAGELNADKICLSRWNASSEAIETLSESGEQPAEEVFRLTDYPLMTKPLYDHEAVQVLVGDPDADPAEVELMLSLGYRSLLAVPVIHQGATVGLIEAMSSHERPWTRTEINRARIISNQFGSAIESLFPDNEPQRLISTPEKTRRRGGAASSGGQGWR
jgi:diguanylate cyclase (GGDEF)-like protein